MEYRLVPFTPVYLQKLTDLLAICFDFASTQKRQAIEWKYNTKSYPRELISWVAVDKNNNIVSHYANLQMPLIQSGKVINALCCLDMATHPNHRGQGLISRLAAKVYENVQQKDFPISFGFSNDEGIKVDKHAHGYGYQIVGRFQKYIQVVMQASSVSFAYKKIARFPKTFKPNQSDFFQIQKTAQYLNWRYVARTEQKYSLYQIIFAPQMIGYLVLRFHDIRIDIHDLINIPVDKLQASIEIVRYEARKHKKKLIVINVLENSFWQKTLRQAGFIKQRVSKRHHYLTVKIHHSQKINSRQILDEQKWILLGGDIL